MVSRDIAGKCLWTLIGTLAVAGTAWGLSAMLAGGSSRGGAGGRVAAAKPAAVSAPAETAGRRPVLVRRDGTAATVIPSPETASSGDRASERELFRLQTENQRLRARLDDMLNWILENVRGTYPLPEEQMANLRIEPVDDSLEVSPDLAQVLRLSEAEKGRMGVAFQESREVLRELETENISVETPAEYQVVLSIPPYAESGEAVRGALYGELLQTLGKARFGRFLQVAGAGLEERFDYFGASDRTLSFEAFADELSGAARLFVRDERALPDESDPDRVNVTASERVVSRLPEEYEAYGAWLPDYVLAFAGAE
jgi:hypothetical protein